MVWIFNLRTSTPPHLHTSFPAPPHLRKALLAYILVAAAAVAVALPTLHNDFVYDDLPIIAHNPHLRDFSNAARLLSPDYFELSGERTFRPVTTLTLYADAAIWGIKPFGFHVTSILLHLLTALLVLATALRLFRPPSAVAAALLFALHPLIVEPVAGISFREDPLAAMFCAASLLAFLRWRDADSPRPPVASWLLYLLALFSKESAGALPVFILLLIVSPRPHKWRRALTAMSGYALAAAAFVAAYFFFLQGGERLGRYPGGGPLEAIPVMVATFGQYLRNFFFPANLCLEYPAQSASWTSPDFLVSSVFLLLLLVSALAAVRRLPGYAFGIALFFTHLIPISNLLPFGAVIANRYMYLPMTGLCIAAGAVISLLESGARGKIQKVVLAVLVAAILAGAARETLRQIPVWRNGETLWGKTAACCPSSPRAHTNYGIALLNAGKTEDAVAPLETAVALDAHYEALNALGTAYTGVGRWDDAIHEFTRAHERNPVSPFPLYNAGLAMMKKGDGGEALRWFRKAIEVSPRFVPAIYNAGNVYLLASRPERAIPFYRRALSIAPDNIEARGNLAVALIQTGRRDLAEKQLKLILSRGPGNETARKLLNEIRRK